MTIKRNDNHSLQYDYNGTNIDVYFTDDYCSFYMPEELEPVFRIRKEIIDLLANQWHGIPCRTDRFAVVEAMKGYLEIHDLQVFVISIRINNE